MHDNLKRSFEAKGLVYNPPPNVVPNTHRALRLTELGRSQGKHEETHDRLMRAYWEEAVNIGDPDALRALATELGLEGADAAIDGEAFADDVQRSTQQAHSIGINAIPAFLLNRRLIVLGAQPEAVFDQAFAQLQEGQ
jgi:predicted DsbA family dithiol-disulfide isomerase